MNADRAPWTRDELRALIPELERSLAEVEASQAEEVRPLPPLTVGECLDHFRRLLGHAGTRPLTQREVFLAGQLLACHAHAVRAETLGHRGRFFVVSEDDVRRLVDARRGGGPR